MKPRRSTQHCTTQKNHRDERRRRRFDHETSHEKNNSWCEIASALRSNLIWFGNRLGANSIPQKRSATLTSLTYTAPPSSLPCTDSQLLFTDSPLSTSLQVERQSSLHSFQRKKWTLRRCGPQIGNLHPSEKVVGLSGEVEAVPFNCMLDLLPAEVLLPFSDPFLPPCLSAPSLLTPSPLLTLL